MKILVINGPNLNLLGVREPRLYGNRTYGDLLRFIEATARDVGVSVEVFQSNHEGVIVDRIQSARGVFDALVVNAAAYTHTSVAILDALKAVGLPTVEVHLSNVYAREGYRHESITAGVCIGQICGFGSLGYRLALEALITKIGG